MSDIPRTDDQIGHDGSKVSAVWIEFSCQLERDLTEARTRIKQLEEESESRWNLAQSAIGSCAEMSSRIKQLEEALSLFIVDCDNLHHSKKHQHGFHDPCPVVDLILDAKEIKP